jgi:protein-S-isoprenylcysteine O-methyltransferase Ste14
MTQSSLPDLGRRGEGWFLIQLALLVAVAVAGALGPAWTGPARAVGVGIGLVLIAFGGILGLRGILDLRDSLTPFPMPVDGARLVDTGAYRLVRHPMYGGLILGSFGWGLLTASVPAFVAAYALAVTLRLKSAREEAWLADQFDAYDAYRARTHRFVPWLY